MNYVQMNQVQMNQVQMNQVQMNYVHMNCVRPEFPGTFVCYWIIIAYLRHK